METPQQRLNKIYHRYNTNASDIESKYKLIDPKSTFTKQTIYNIEDEKTKSISAKTAQILLEIFPDLNFIWLTTGNGEMTTPTTDQKLQALDKIEIDDEKTTTYVPTPQKFAEKTYKKEVIVIPAKAQLGLQSYLFADEIMNDLEKKIITVDQDYKGRYYEIECVGDSMDANHRNAIREGDTVLCREISKLHWKNKFHKNDWEFVFFHNEYGIIIKSIKDQNLETGDLLLCSYNPDKDEFPDFTINIKDCYAICNVVQVLQNRKKYYTL